MVGHCAPLGFQKPLWPRNALYTLPSEPQPDRKRICGLESLLNWMSCFSKDKPAINEHHYHITKNHTMKRYIIFTMSIKTNI